MSTENSPTTELSWSIDEIAALVGVPTRTVREYRTQGLIDAPRMEGRVGRYDDSHRRRLELIARLQERGYSLAAIRDLCAADASGRSLTDVLSGAATVSIDEGAVAYTTSELAAIVPALATPRNRALASEADLIRLVGRKWHVRSPALLTLVGDVIAAGAPPASAIRMAAGMADGAQVQARAFADLVADDMWNPTSPDVQAAVSVGRRARLQLTKAAASLVVHHVGMELRARAVLPGGEGLDQLVDGLRIGIVRGSDE